MDRKYQRSAKIPGLILILVALAAVQMPFTAKGPYAGNSTRAKIRHSSSSQSSNDSELRRKSTTLDSIRIQLEKGRARLQALQNEEGNYVARLDQLEKNITSSKEYLNALSLRIESIGRTIEKLQDSLVMAEKEIKGRQAILKRRLRSAYMAGPMHPIYMMLSARDPIDAVNRIRYLNDLARYDKALAKRIQESRIEIDRKKGERETERANLSMLIDNKKKEQEVLLVEEDSRKQMLEKVRSEKKTHLAMIAELESAQKELNRIVKLLEGKRKKEKPQEEKKLTGAFEKRKGKLPWPAEGKLVGRYGKVIHPVYKTVTMNNGIEIAGSAGQQVECVAPGIVIHTGSMRGLGKLVIVDHSGGYITIYSHLGKIEIANDAKVDNGTAIGTLGENTDGSASVHFEIRRSSETVDPAEWLEKR